MRSEASFQPAYGGNHVDKQHNLLYNRSAVLPYVVDGPPPKRLRVNANHLSHVRTDRNNGLYWDGIGSAQSLNGYFPAQQTNVPAEVHEQARPQSVPLQGKRSRKKKGKQNSQDAAWIQESFAFPAQQTWLEVRSRQRKAVVEVGTVKEVDVSASVAPDEGEALCLEKHADRIAALIAQKRRENDSKLFRERMSLQQRLHRGETDEKDKVIAASHDELKRKMELGAKGIFEQDPPNGKEPAMPLEEPQAALSCTPSRRSSVTSVVSSGSTSPTPALLQIEQDDAEESDAATTDSDDDEELSPHQPHETRSEKAVAVLMSQRPHSPLQIVTTIAPPTHETYEQTAYSQTQATVTTQTFAFSNVPSVPHTTQLFLMQPRFTNHRYHNPHIYQPQPQHEVMPQQWTSQIFEALPSTSTPVLETREVVTAQYASAGENQELAFDPFGSSLDAETYGFLRNSTLPLDDSSSVEQRHSPVLRSNLNIFTRQARENGVIGGNNNYLELGGEGGRRRNMFDHRA